MIKTFEDLDKLVDDELAILKSKALEKAVTVKIGGIVRYASEKDLSRAAQAVKEFATRSQGIALKLLQDAMYMGYESELKARSEIAQHDNAHLAIDFDIDDAEEQELYQWPVLGHDIIEISAHRARNIEFNIRSLISGPDRGMFPVEQLTGKIEQAQQAFANELVTSSTNAYLAGTQAARELIKGAISGY